MIERRVGQVPDGQVQLGARLALDLAPGRHRLAGERRVDGLGVGRADLPRGTVRRSHRVRDRPALDDGDTPATPGGLDGGPEPEDAPANDE